MTQIRKILIANRGEIAVRIIRTAKEMGIECIAVYSEGEERAYHTRNADGAYFLGPGSLADTYLNIQKIINVAQQSECDAIHPGYGFLSENAAFAKACEEAEIKFIGPRSSVIELMGDKVQAKSLAKKAGVPVLDPITGSVAQILEQGAKLNYPILIKAAAGGGGKGMRKVENQEQLKSALEGTSREAKSYFGDERVFVEQFIEEPRHIEVQVLADEHGNAVHLFERECSWQRRHQKIIEEAPSPSIDETKRKALGDAALTLVEASGYTNAGTVEFLVDRDLNFYFLEMNTRIQVEHPVTELITGIDLIQEQIRIAEGKPLSFSQDEIKINGHAIECRIYAENPDNDFTPSPGYIHHYHSPSKDKFRIDEAIDGETMISSHFDPMISKLITHGADRDIAINKMGQALNDYAIHGIHQNIGFLKSIITGKRFQKNDINTRLLDEPDNDILEDYYDQKRSVQNEQLIAAALAHDFYASQNANNIWQKIGFWRHITEMNFLIKGDNVRITIDYDPNADLQFYYNDKTYKVSCLKKERAYHEFSINGQRQGAYVTNDNSGRYHLTINGQYFIIDRQDNILTKYLDVDTQNKDVQQDGKIVAPMHGTVLQLYIKKGQQVVKGDKLLVLEAMKMENVISAQTTGTVKDLYIKENDKVEDGKVLLTLDLEKPD